MDCLITNDSYAVLLKAFTAFDLNLVLSFFVYILYMICFYLSVVCNCIFTCLMLESH